MHSPDHLIFLHIPKTAGSTLHTVLRRQFAASRRHFTHSIRDTAVLESMPAERRNGIQLLHGHLPYGIHQLFTPGTCEYFTILRDPVSRVISTYNHFLSPRERKLHGFYEEFHKNKYTLREFVEGGRIVNLDNGMVRFISGDFDRPFGSCDSTMLDKALKNLEAFALIGLNDDFDTFLLRLCDRYGWGAPWYASRRVARVGIRLPEVDTETLKTIQELNAFDKALYDTVKPRILREQEALGEAFRLRVEKFRTQNARYGQLLSRIKTPPWNW